MPMVHILPDLPYDLDALEPHISRETLAFHHGEHHSAYVKKLNSLTQNTGFREQPLMDIVKYATGDIFNNAAQAWNHEFYWNCLSPQGGGEPVAAIAEAIQRDFKSFEQFRDDFTQAAMRLFGSGWAWLVLNEEDQLDIMTTTNADTPLREGLTPLLACDVWEHAYYLDYRNRRQDYLEAFWSVVNWEFASRQLLAIRPPEPLLASNQ